MEALANKNTVPVPVPDIDKMLYGWKMRQLNDQDFAIIVQCLLRIVAPALPRLGGTGSILALAHRRLPAGMQLEGFRDTVALPLALQGALGYFLIPAAYLPSFVVLDYAGAKPCGQAYFYSLDAPGLLERLAKQGISRETTVRLLYRQLLGAASESEVSQLTRNAVLALLEVRHKINTVLKAKGLAW